jgi:IS30 family transposase
MVGMEHYSQLNQPEREFIHAALAQGLGLREIGRQLGRSHSTVLRELERNSISQSDDPASVYSPSRADQQARQRRQRRFQKFDDRSLQTFVIQKLTRGWSPEQIAGRLKLKVPASRVSHEAIYQFIYAPENRSLRLWEFLRRGRSRRQGWNGRKVRTTKRQLIAHRISIEQRPQQANERRRVGDWESDLLQGLQGNPQAVTVSVDRKSRYLVLDKLFTPQAHERAQTLVQTFQRKFLPVHTVTLDNGKENRLHQTIAQALRCQVYFCHPYRAWEKGTVENSIGLVRSYIPKRTDLRAITPADLRSIALELNDRPRKCLGFYTPSEMMYKATGWCT